MSLPTPPHTHPLPPQITRRLCIWLSAAWGSVKPTYLRGITDLPHWLPYEGLDLSPFSPSPAQKPTQHMGRGTCTGVGCGIKKRETVSTHNPEDGQSDEGHSAVIKTGFE